MNEAVVKTEEPPPPAADPAVEVKGEHENGIKSEPAAAAAAPPSSQPTEADLERVKTRLREILPAVDLQTTTEKMLRRRLEEELALDLSGSKEKAAIRSEVGKESAKAASHRGGGIFQDVMLREISTQVP